jgi:hypothetical protein
MASNDYYKGDQGMYQGGVPNQGGYGQQPYYRT